LHPLSVRKGMKKYYLKEAQNIDFSKVEIQDWIEGYGQIMCHAEKDFIRKFGSLIGILKDRIDALDGALDALSTQPVNPKEG